MKEIQELFLFNSNCIRDTCLKEKGAVDRKENGGDIMGKAQQYKGEGAEGQSILNNQPQIHIEHSLIISIFKINTHEQISDSQFITLISSTEIHPLFP